MIRLLQVIPLLLLTTTRAEAQGRASVERKCECLESVVEGERRNGNCIEARALQSSVRKVVDLKTVPDKETKYMCLVEASSTCQDKRLVPGTEDQYFSYEACQYFVPPPAYFPGNYQPGCGPEGGDFPWKEFNGNCYMLVKEKASWNDARKKCRNHSVMS